MINEKLIHEAVYNLCIEANTVLNDDVFAKILDTYNLETEKEAKHALGLILQNAKISSETKKPLCQDTGQVLVFVKGSGKCIPDNIKDIINNAVAQAYEENFYRKSIVKDAVFNRVNTKTNTPCVIYTELTDKDELEIELLLKGGGSENVCDATMLSPSSTQDDIVEYVTSVIKKAGSKGCPPYFLGIGIGGTIDYAALLSKKALLLEKNIDQDHENLAQKIKKAVNDLKIGPLGTGGSATALDVKILTDFTHIACMPVAVTTNCHSSRHVKCVIKEGKMAGGQEGKKLVESYTATEEDFSDYIKINASDIDKIKSLKIGDKVLLSGELYTARDAAHKRLLDMIQNGQKLPFDLKDKIIFYAGPCPDRKTSPLDQGQNIYPCPDRCNECEVNSIGPTTASRMDKFAPYFYEKGILATIGKGERSDEVKKAIKQNRGLYFTAFGGIASYLSGRFIKKELIAFEDLGTEAIYKVSVCELPLRVDFC